MRGSNRHQLVAPTIQMTPYFVQHVRPILHEFRTQAEDLGIVGHVAKMLPLSLVHFEHGTLSVGWRNRVYESHLLFPRHCKKRECRLRALRGNERGIQRGISKINEFLAGFLSVLNCDARTNDYNAQRVERTSDGATVSEQKDLSRSQRAGATRAR